MKKTIYLFNYINNAHKCNYSKCCPVPRESAPCNATEHQIIVAESYISGILDEVKNGMGFADAKAKSNRIFFTAWLN